MKVKSYKQWLKDKEAGKLKGFYADVPNQEYHSGPGISRSDLDVFSRSPKHWKFYKSQPDEPTKAMLLGSIVNDLLFAPNDFKAKYVQAFEGDRRTKAGRDEYELWIADNQGKTPVDSEMMQKAESMVAAVQTDEFLHDMLSVGKPELSVYAEVEGALLRARPDLLLVENAFFIDLKTTTDASQQTYINKVYNFGYHRQGAFYRDVIRAASDGEIEMRAFGHIVVESIAPHAVNYFQLGEEFLQLGEAEYKPTLQRFHKALTENNFDEGYSKDFKVLVPKVWMMYSNEGDQV